MGEQNTMVLFKKRAGWIVIFVLLGCVYALTLMLQLFPRQDTIYSAIDGVIPRFSFMKTFEAEFRSYYITHFYFNRWLWIHVYSSEAGLLLGTFQFLSRLQKIPYRLHAIMGIIFCALMLVAGLTAIPISLRAFGGPIAKSGLVALSVIWITSVLGVMWSAYGKNRAAHRRWTIRCMAISASVVAFRLEGLVLVKYFSLEQTWQITAWMCWIPSIVLLECLFLRKRKSR